MDKILIISAPSGAGKSTLIKHLLRCFPNQLAFSVSATTRSPRHGEIHGEAYYFMSEQDFQNHIARNEFIEYEQVYAGLLYGTLRSELDRMWALHKLATFEIDVNGGLKIQEQYRSQSLSLFIAPPSLDTLRQRLISRATETPERLQQRLVRADMEMSKAPFYDRIIVNDNLETAQAEIAFIVGKFLEA
jgi:guanylate kinase